MQPRNAPESAPADRPPPCEVCGTPCRDDAYGADVVLQRCPRCGHVMRDVARANAGARSHPWGGNQHLDRLRLQLTWRRLRRLLPRNRRLRVLELGFGAGHLLARLLREHHEVWGIERSLLEVPVRRDVLTRATLQQCAAEEAALPQGYFDVVYAVHVIEHLTDPHCVFAHVHQALRPGGVFYAMTPNADSLGLTLFGAHWWNLEDPTHVRFYSQRSIAHSLRAVGFGTVSTRITRSDSITLDATSALRRIAPASDAHGVLQSRARLLAAAAMTPLSLVARAAVPRLSPTIEIWATRGEK